MQTLVGLTTAELEAIATAWGEPSYRGRQLARWIYHRCAHSFEEMTDLPARFRARLCEAYDLQACRIIHRDDAPDGTRKYLLTLRDGERVETVYLPYEDRVSICLSTQVGCPAGCKFCATAQGGLARNLTAGEIVAQLLLLQADNPNRRISHAVYMGMGEPLLNYKAVIKSIRLLIREVGLSGRHLTLSTVGIVPGIRRLAEENLPITLALSLHAPNDVLRQRLIPTARKWKLAEILEACRDYYAKTRRNLTFEYLLLAGVNDHPDQAKELAELLQDLPGNINLIPFNYVETPEGFQRPDKHRVAAFREVLERSGRVVTQRMERGHAIGAACGQLRRSVDTLRTSAVRV